MKDKEPYYIHLENVPTYETALQYLSNFGKVVDFQNVKYDMTKTIIHGKIVKVFPAVPVENGKKNKVFLMKQENNQINSNEVFRIIFQVEFLGPLDELTVGCFLSVYKPCPFMTPNMRSFYGAQKNLILWYAKPFKTTVPLKVEKKNLPRTNLRQDQMSEASNHSSLKTISGNVRESFFEVAEMPFTIEASSTNLNTRSDDRLMMPPPSVREHNCCTTSLRQCHCSSTLCGGHLRPSCAQHSCAVTHDAHMFGCHRHPCCAPQPLPPSASCSHNCQRSPCHSNCRSTTSTCCNRDGSTCQRMKPEDYHISYRSTPKMVDLTSKSKSISARTTIHKRKRTNNPPDAVASSSSVQNDWYVHRWVKQTKTRNKDVDLPHSKETCQVVKVGEGSQTHDTCNIEDDSFSSISQVIDKSLQNPGPSTTKLAASGSGNVEKQQTVFIEEEGETNSSNGSSFSDASTLFVLPNRPLIEKGKTTSSLANAPSNPVEEEKQLSKDGSEIHEAPPVDGNMNSNSLDLDDTQKTWSQPIVMAPDLLEKVNKRIGTKRMQVSSENSSQDVSRKKKKLYDPRDDSLICDSPKAISHISTTSAKCVTVANNVEGNVEISGEESEFVAQPDRPQTETDSTERETRQLGSQESDGDIVPPSDTESWRKLADCVLINKTQDASSKSKKPENEIISESEIDNNQVEHGTGNEMKIVEDELQLLEELIPSDSVHIAIHDRVNSESTPGFNEADIMVLKLLDDNRIDNCDLTDFSRDPSDNQNLKEISVVLPQQADSEIQNSNMELTLLNSEDPETFNSCLTHSIDELVVPSSCNQMTNNETVNPEEPNQSNQRPVCSQSLEFSLLVTEHSAANSGSVGETEDSRVETATKDATDSYHLSDTRLSNEITRASPASTVFYDAENVNPVAEGDVQHTNIIAEAEANVYQSSDGVENHEVEDVSRKLELPDQIFQVEGIIIDIQPHISDGIENIVEGVCKNRCKSTFSYRVAVKSKRMRHFCRLCSYPWHPICPECLKSGTKQPLCLQFHFELHVALGKNVLRVQVEREEAVNFLGVTVKQYLAKKEAARNIIDQLKHLESSKPNEKKMRLKGHLFIRTETRFDEVVPLIVNTNLTDFKWSMG